MKQNKDSVLTLRISEEEKEVLKQIANEKDLSMSQLVRCLIRAYVDNPDIFLSE